MTNQKQTDFPIIKKNKPCTSSTHRKQNFPFWKYDEYSSSVKEIADNRRVLNLINLARIVVRVRKKTLVIA